MEQIFSYLTTTITLGLMPALLASFLWGILSIVLSPCHLSSIPLIIGFISMRGAVKIKSTILLSLVFAAGILLTIAIIGGITVSLGRLMGDIGQWVNYMVAAIMIIFGLYLMDILHLNWDSIKIDAGKSSGYLGAFMLGLFFGIGLGPCTFAFLAPVLAVVFQIAHENFTRSILLIAAFGIGHFLVIVVAGSLMNLVQKYLNWAGNSGVITRIKQVSGVLILLGGFYFIYTAI